MASIAFMNGITHMIYITFIGDTTAVVYPHAKHNERSMHKANH